MDLYKNHKYSAIHTWKKRGVKYDDIESLYLIYINTMECQHCNKEFINTRDRCLDHDHETGEFRKIVCQTCNANDNYINYPDGVPSLNERHKIYRDNNKDKLKEKFNCDCGGKYTYNHKDSHFRTKKHLAYMETI
tara:strand:+ start:39 stop:443 length:405 start_codon:yes stop_codon:yes gene_type:complete